MTGTRYPAWLRGLFALSGAACTALLMQTVSKLSFGVTLGLSLILLLVFFLKYHLLETLLAPNRLWVRCWAAILALTTAYNVKSSFYTNCSGWIRKLLSLLGLPGQALLLRLAPWAVAAAALPMLFACFLWFTDRIAALGLQLWRDSDFTERFFLLGVGLLFAMMILFSYVCTQAFYGAHLWGRWFNFDLIYSADSGFLVHTDVYRNIGASQNDLRQPLFGLFALPFSQTAWLLSRLLFFLPDMYVTVNQIMQMLLFLVAVVLVARMMGLKGAEKGMFLLLMTVSWPTLIFVLTAEQYLFAVFYLVMMLYLDRESPERDLSYLAATGSMLTTGIWFPLLTWDRDFSRFVKKTLRLCGLFFAVTFICGRLTTFLDIPEYIEGYGAYTGADVAPVQKLMQYVNFVRACLIAPPSGVDNTTYGHLSWQMLPVTSWSLPGLVLIASSAAGLVLSRKDRFGRCCGVWMGFSLLLLGIVGWGTIDNGLSLYTLYFGWAFTAMSFRLLDRLLSRWRGVKLGVMLALILALGAVNIQALRSVLLFGSQFYPAIGGIS